MLVVEFSGKSAVYRACATARFLPAADGRKCPERVDLSCSADARLAAANGW